MSRQCKFAVRRLKHVATINDEALSEDTDPDLDLKYVDIGNVDSSGRVHEIVNYRFADSPSRARRVVRNGDVIISTVRTYLQAIAPIENLPQNLVVSTGFAVVRPLSALLIPGFCKYAMREPTFLAEVEKRSVGINYPAINSSDLATIRIPLPSIPEQRKIAAFLDRETARIDVLVDAKEHLLQLLEAKLRALISRIVTCGINPNENIKSSGVAWLGRIPAHWPMVRAKFLWRELQQPVEEGDEIVTCFRDGQVTLRRNRREEGFTNAIKELGYQHIQAGQLVLHSMDAFAGAIGVSDSSGKCTPEYIVCEPTRADVHNPYYGFLLRDMALKGYIQAACPAVRERAPRIHFSQFGNMFFPVPPIPEQKGIVAALEKERSRTRNFEAALCRSIDLLKERRAALITAAVTGQLSPEEMSE